jgi:nicotinate-nucleotide adenylyltransferase
MKSKVGIFGGSFDPVHWGHIKPVQAALKFFKLSYVIYLPASKPPHKLNLKLEDPFHRMAMLSIGLQNYENFKISTFDLLNPGSKTFDSLLYFKSHLNEEIFFILGSDSLLDFKNWYKPEKILEIANLIVLTRPEFEIEKIKNKLPDYILKRINFSIFTFPHPAYSISGTDIRERFKKNLKLNGLLPKNVLKYIVKNNLYKE